MAWRRCSAHAPVVLLRNFLSLQSCAEARTSQASFHIQTTINFSTCEGEQKLITPIPDVASLNPKQGVRADARLYLHFVDQRPRDLQETSARCQYIDSPLSPLRSRAFHTASSTAFQVSGSESTVPSGLLENDVTPKPRRRKNLFDLLWRSPDWGVGGRFAKRHWDEGSFYEVTQIRLNKSGRTGAAWGVFYQQGAPASAVAKIGGVNKPCWKEVKGGKKEDSTDTGASTLA